MSEVFLCCINIIIQLIFYLFVPGIIVNAFVLLPFLVNCCRFNLSFEENAGHSDDSKVDSEEVGRPSFADIKKVTGFLDKELSASGFTRKDQDDIERV